ncbi:MAG: hypothetical protein JWM57_4307 [Phycisphaerales bacterium]|nr:hypothetical protein [Phycisphaerales bacterium]
MPVRSVDIVSSLLQVGLFMGAAAVLVAGVVGLR